MPSDKKTYSLPLIEDQNGNGIGIDILESLPPEVAKLIFDYPDILSAFVRKPTLGGPWCYVWNDDPKIVKEITKDVALGTRSRAYIRANGKSKTKRS